MYPLPRIVESFQSSVRYKLLFLVLSPVVVVLPILLALMLYQGSAFFDRLLNFKIQSDLIVAHEYMERVVSAVGSNVGRTAESYKVVSALEGEESQAIARLLAEERERNKLDFLNLLDAQGNLLAAGNEQTLRSGYSGWRVVQTAAAGRLETQIDLFSPEQLAGISDHLRETAFTPILPTENAAPSDRKSETRGMIVHAAAPIFDEEKQLARLLHGGMLLNGNLDFVDTINSIVYKEASLPLGSQGTVTLFLDDVRVATNVRLFQGERALGTRVSQQVRDHVLGRGETWLGRAFVVNDWYISGYEPIHDSLGERVGMLYVGYLDAPFTRVKYIALGVTVGLFLLISAAGGWFALSWASSIFRPLERMDHTMSAVEAGEASARVGSVASKDEIGRLAEHFDLLLENLQRQSEKLRRWADELDLKVAERTRELQLANQSLREAQRQLLMSEKLAALGQLTAGVAHEINNPIAVIQGNLDVARVELGDAAKPVLKEIRLIDEQVNRIRIIVTKLLQFARPQEFAGYVEQVDVNVSLDDCLLLVEHTMRSVEIKVVQDYRAVRQVGIKRTELQQILINLMVNAVHAMPQGGTLTLVTRDWDDKGVVISIKDTGHGIKKDDLSRIFDPFYTTKKQQGTGLGPSICYSLVQRYGGEITVQSQVDVGTEFSVWLLSEPVFLEGGSGENVGFMESAG